MHKLLLLHAQFHRLFIEVLLDDLIFLAVLPTTKQRMW